MFTRARWRLVASYSAILAIILVGLSFTVFTLFERNLYGDVDGTLSFLGSGYSRFLTAHANQYSTSCSIPASPPIINDADNTDYAVVDCTSAIVNWNSIYQDGVYPNGLQRALSGHTDLRTIFRGGHYWRALSVPVHAPNGVGGRPWGAVQFFRPVDDQVHALHRLEQVLIFGGVAGMLLAALAGLFLAGRTLAPIRMAFERQRRFIADASHELRTPLTLIRSSAEMVCSSRSKLEAEDAELLGDIMVEVDRMSRLVTDLLTLARVDGAQISLNHDPVDLADVAKAITEDIQPLVNQKRLTARTVLKGRSIVIGDELRLRQLLLILLDNAIKYTQPGGDIETAVESENGHVSVSVQDTGVGIPSEALPHVFDRFFRADDARTHESGGAGLGLSIAAWIVKAHSGRIHISSRPGGGTNVRVDLPAALVRSG